MNRTTFYVAIAATLALGSYAVWYAAFQYYAASKLWLQGWPLETFSTAVYGGIAALVAAACGIILFKRPKEAVEVEAENIIGDSETEMTVGDKLGFLAQKKRQQEQQAKEAPKKSDLEVQAEESQKLLEQISGENDNDLTADATRGATDGLVTPKPSPKQTVPGMPSIGIPFDNGKKIYDEATLKRYFNQQVAIATNAQIVDRIAKGEIKVDVDTLTEYGLSGVTVTIDKNGNGNGKQEPKHTTPKISEDIDAKDLEEI